MNKSNQLITSLEKLNKLLHNESLKSDEIGEIKRNIYDIKTDSKKLEKVFTNIASNATNPHELFDETIAYFNIYFGDIIQELENIQEIIDSVYNRK